VMMTQLSRRKIERPRNRFYLAMLYFIPQANGNKLFLFPVIICTCHRHEFDPSNP